MPKHGSADDQIKGSQESPTTGWSLVFFAVSLGSLDGDAHKLSLSDHKSLLWLRGSGLGSERTSWERNTTGQLSIHYRKSEG